ncbi:MAG TPA: hypothetical protein VHA06_09120, partial [Candidatus Angelobacter sp.]|nr:hypothetical protein [Candidatus Angelobacter sp.]
MQQGSLGVVFRSFSICRSLGEAAIPSSPAARAMPEPETLIPVRIAVTNRILFMFFIAFDFVLAGPARLLLFCPILIRRSRTNPSGIFQYLSL